MASGIGYHGTQVLLSVDLRLDIGSPEKENSIRAVEQSPEIGRTRIFPKEKRVGQIAADFIK